MKLSIGMIVKDEERNLRECLTCLRPILTRVDSELIIADTGSTDRTAAIAREFTQNVFKIPWNHDFSEARNHTVRAAKGEWYMYLDADDFFEDTEELVQFFNNGEYMRYNSADYQIHQYHYARDDKTYILTNAPRMVKLTGNTRFESIIHETLTFEPPCKYLNSYARHTGYAYDKEPDEKYRKHERNISLLLNAHNKNASNMRNIALIVNEYM